MAPRIIYAKHLTASPAHYPRLDQGQPCEKGETAAKSGCVPSEGDAPRKRGAPASQLPEAVRSRLKELGIKKLPESIIDPATIWVGTEGDDVNDRAVIKWIDAGGSPQSEYTPEFHAKNAATKWKRIGELDKIVDGHVDELFRDLAKAEPGSREHSALAIALILSQTGLRPGSEGMKKGHFGISTLRKSHVRVNGDKVFLDFIGKSGKRNKSVLKSAALAEALTGYLGSSKKRGERLFGASVADVRKHAPPGGKLKDFRTIVATREAERAIRTIKPPPPLHPDRKKAAKQIAKAMMKTSKMVASKINNTAAIARKSYIHPRVFENWRATLGDS